MIFLVLLALMYFLPSIIGRNKADAGSIFLVNLLFGWTVVGWMVAFLWACASDAKPVPVQLVPVGAGRFCSQCGSLSLGAPHFCGACGRAV